MKKQSAIGLFFSMFLRAVVVILGLVILVFGTVFIVQVIKNGKGSSKTPATTVGEGALNEPEVRDDLLSADTTEATVTPEETTNTEAPNIILSTDKKILVLNSTNVKGLAGRWCTALNEAGYANTKASDYSTPQEKTRIIAKEDGVGQDLIGLFREATYEVGTVTSGTSVSTSEYDIIIIVGSSDDYK